MARKNTNARKKAKHMPIETLIAPPPEQIARGYTAGFVMDDNGLKAMAYQNTGHDPVARWCNAVPAKLDQRQKAAIDTVRRLWEIVGISQRVTASYGERTAGSISTELCSLSALEAKQDLARIEGYFSGVRAYWDVFQNCCRFGMAAGVAGSDIGCESKTGQVRALTIVAFIADIIADRERI